MFVNFKNVKHKDILLFFVYKYISCKRKSLKFILIKSLLERKAVLKYLPFYLTYFIYTWIFTHTHTQRTRFGLSIVSLTYALWEKVLNWKWILQTVCNIYYWIFLVYSVFGLFSHIYFRPRGKTFTTVKESLFLYSFIPYITLILCINTKVYVKYQPSYLRSLSTAYPVKRFLFQI